jgi:predicted ATP-grasp superfamily ATP-dependent carboligase
MNEPLLMVSTASQWLGPARMARTLARANCEVSLLAPASSLAAKSRYIAKRHVLAGNAIPMEWLQSLIAAVDDIAPRLLVPCDEMAIRLLFALVLEPPPDLPSATRLALEALVRTSLGDPAFYQTSIDKILLPPAAEALGIRLPAYALVHGLDEAIDCATALGYPLVLKRRFGFAGEGVAIVADADDLIDQGQALLRPDQLDLGQRRAPQLLVQSFVRGAYHSQAIAAWEGVPLAGFAWERQVATLPCKGQTSVLRFVHSPESETYAETLCKAFGISGFFNVQFVLDEDGRAYLLEINRRVVTHMHMGERVGADLGVAMARKLRGLPADPRAKSSDEFNSSVAIFPREWLRDPRSSWLRQCPADLPWDEPALLRAMLAMRH